MTEREVLDRINQIIFNAGKTGERIAVELRELIPPPLSNGERE